MRKTSDKLETTILMLYGAGEGTNTIAERLGLHRTMIQRVLLRNNIKLRKTSPLCHYNVSYFSRYSDETCYWAGFILADGYVRSDRAVVALHLCQRDAEHLENFSLALCNKGKVLHHGSSCLLALSGNWMVDDLAKQFSVTPRKSLTAEFPKQVPQKHWSHLIRGIFDGDGSVTVTTVPAISIVGTENLLHFMAEVFYEAVGVRLKSKNRIPPLQPVGRAFSMSYSGKNAKEILDWMYENSTASTRLSRKYDRYRELFY